MFDWEIELTVPAETVATEASYHGFVVANPVPVEAGVIP